MTIPVEHLRAAGLGDEVESLSEAVATYLDEEKSLTGGGSNIAVISDPFGGREALLDYAEELLDNAERVKLSSAVESSEELPKVPEDRALIVDDCHYLYQRRVDGFNLLEDFLSLLANTDTLVITSWNRYSWMYLDAVKRIGESFPRQIRIPELTTDQIKSVIETHVETEPEFIDTGEAGRIKTVNLVRKELPLWGDRSVRIPYLKPNPEWFISWTEFEEGDEIEAVVYENIRLVSHGNPGIATTIWEDSVHEPEDGEGTEIAPAYVDDPVTESDFDVTDDDRAYLLWLVVSMEDVGRDVLETVTKNVNVDVSLQPLVDRGVLSLEGDRVHLEPMGLHPAVKELRRGRLIW